jgi:hypothetical protein
MAASHWGAAQTPEINIVSTAMICPISNFRGRHPGVPLFLREPVFGLRDSLRLPLQRSFKLLGVFIRG